MPPGSAAGVPVCAAADRPPSDPPSARPPPRDLQPGLQGPAAYKAAPVYRRALTQVVLVAVVCFCCPGMYNSIVSMAGSIDQQVASDAVSALYAAFAVTSLVAPAAVNVLGPRAPLAMGTLGYIAYVLSLMHYQHHGVGTLVIVGGALNGVCAGLLWTAQGQLTMAYPNREVKGWYQAVLWMIFNLGGVVGGCITLGTNYSSAAADAGDATFAAFAAIMAAGTVLSVFVADPATVVRADGEYVRIDPFPSAMREARAVLGLFADQRMLLLTPLFLYSNFFYTYQFSCYNYALFNARTQGINNACYWGAQMLGAWALARFLDSSLRLRTRAAGSLVVVSAAVVTSWGLAAWVAREKGVSIRTQDDEGRLMIDFVDGPAEWYAPFLLYVLWGLLDAGVQCWSYWFMGQLSDDPATLGRYSGFYKAVQSGGAAVAWKINGSRVDTDVQLFLNLGLFVVGVIPAMYLSLRAGGVADAAAAAHETRRLVGGSDDGERGRSPSASYQGPSPEATTPATTPSPGHFAGSTPPNVLL